MHHSLLPDISPAAFTHRKRTGNAADPDKAVMYGFKAKITAMVFGGNVSSFDMTRRSQCFVKRYM